MANEKLRHALARSGLTIEEFADVIQADAKTVQRWLGGRTPYPRHRARIGAALDTTETVLWPDARPARATATSEHSSTTVATTDVVGGYADTDDPAAPRPRVASRARERGDRDPHADTRRAHRERRPD